MIFFSGDARRSMGNQLAIPCLNNHIRYQKASSVERLTHLNEKADPILQAA
jgi:hypothetical protein